MSYINIHIDIIISTGYIYIINSRHTVRMTIEKKPNDNRACATGVGLEK